MREAEQQMRDAERQMRDAASNWAISTSRGISRGSSGKSSSSVTAPASASFCSRRRTRRPTRSGPMSRGSPQAARPRRPVFSPETSSSSSTARRSPSAKVEADEDESAPTARLMELAPRPQGRRQGDAGVQARGRDQNNHGHRHASYGTPDQGVHRPRAPVDRVPDIELGDLPDLDRGRPRDRPRVA